MGGHGQISVALGARVSMMSGLSRLLTAWHRRGKAWGTEAPVGTARYRFCLAVLVGRLAPDPVSRAHLMSAAFFAPLRDRVPWLRDRWQTVRLVEPPGVVTWTVGPATDFDVLNEVLVLGEYDNLELGSPRVILDLGSHIGVSILRLRGAYPDAHIYGFEPDAATFTRLARNIGQLDHVSVLPWAIGDADGQTAFYPRRQSWLSSVQFTDGAAAITVESVTLDTALKRLDTGVVDLIKIDVEGAEVSILSGSGSLQEVRMIVGELHGEAACSDVVSLLADFDVETRGHPDHRHFRARRRAAP